MSGESKAVTRFDMLDPKVSSRLLESHACHTSCILKWHATAHRRIQMHLSIDGLVLLGLSTNEREGKVLKVLLSGRWIPRNQG